MYVHMYGSLYRFKLENNNIDKDKGRDAFQILLISYS